MPRRKGKMAILTSINDDVKAFYDRYQFPGPYHSLDCYSGPIDNPYLRIIDRAVSRFPSGRVLDIGCGTGLISNMLAVRYPECEITAVDFANSIDHGKLYSDQHGTSNIRWIQSDITKLDLDDQFEIVICQGVLHHIPQWQSVLDKIKNHCVVGGLVVIGLYHPWGKILKQYINIDYNSEILRMDQEHHPFEIDFNWQQVQTMFDGWNLEEHWPGHKGLAMKLKALFNSSNGGLITYVWRKT